MALLKSNINALKKGAQAPGFTLKNIDGKMVSLAQFKGKIVVVIFMCNHCPYVKPHMDEIASIQNDYAKKGVAVICINANDSEQYPEDDFRHMQALAEQKGYQYYLLDEAQNVAKAYGATCTPDPFIFNKEHKLVYHGRINDALSPEQTPTINDMREVLDEIIAGRDIPDWFRFSMGCSIKWK